MGGKRHTETVAADAAGIARAVAVLRAGGLVAVPTETVYGLAARADDAAAVARIYAAKGRPSFNPLIVHLSDPADAARYADLPPAAAAFAQAYWPGPVTLVLPRRADAGLPDAVTAGLPTVALRVPAHAVARAVIAGLGVPVAAPSANRSGFVSPTTAAHVLATLDGRIDLVLDGGATAAGIESTIFAWRGTRWEELRPGPADGSAWRSGPAQRPGAAVEAPGQLASHYAPGKPMRLEAMGARAGEYLIGFGRIAGDCSLSASGDLGEAAHRLYACLHRAAAAPHPRIAVAPVPAEGIGAAINDRLRRAAT